jgi:26S proteasome regulatory subunit N9
MLQQKIHLSALLSLIFSRPPHSRTLPFQLIAEETRLPVNEVEYLVMKALSLELIKGTIDQVEQLVRITWMQGRVLDKKGIEGMKDRLEEWSQGVKALERWVYREGKEVWVK